MADPADTNPPVSDLTKLQADLTESVQRATTFVDGIQTIVDGVIGELTTVRDHYSSFIPESNTPSTLPHNLLTTLFGQLIQKLKDVPADLKIKFESQINQLTNTINDYQLALAVYETQLNSLTELQATHNRQHEERITDIKNKEQVITQKQQEIESKEKDLEKAKINLDLATAKADKSAALLENVSQQLSQESADKSKHLQSLQDELSQTKQKLSQATQQLSDLKIATQKGQSEQRTAELQQARADGQTQASEDTMKLVEELKKQFHNQLESLQNEKDALQQEKDTLEKAHLVVLKDNRAWEQNDSLLLGNIEKLEKDRVTLIQGFKTELRTVRDETHRQLTATLSAVQGFVTQLQQQNKLTDQKVDAIDGSIKDNYQTHRQDVAEMMTDELRAFLVKVAKNIDAKLEHFDDGMKVIKEGQTILNDKHMAFVDHEEKLRDDGFRNAIVELEMSKDGSIVSRVSELGNQLENAVTQSSDTYIRMTESMKANKDELDTLQRDLDRKSESLVEANEKVSDLTQQNVDLTQENTNLIQQNLDLKTDLDKCQTHAQTLQDKNDKLEKDLDALAQNTPAVDQPTGVVGGPVPQQAAEGSRSQTTPTQSVMTGAQASTTSLATVHGRASPTTPSDRLRKRQKQTDQQSADIPAIHEPVEETRQETPRGLRPLSTASLVGGDDFDGEFNPRISTTPSQQVVSQRGRQPRPEPLPALPTRTHEPQSGHPRTPTQTTFLSTAQDIQAPVQRQSQEPETPTRRGSRAISRVFGMFRRRDSSSQRPSTAETTSSMGASTSSTRPVAGAATPAVAPTTIIPQHGPEYQRALDSVRTFAGPEYLRVFEAMRLSEADARQHAGHVFRSMMERAVPSLVPDLDLVSATTSPGCLRSRFLRLQPEFLYGDSFACKRCVTRNWLCMDVQRARGMEDSPNTSVPTKIRSKKPSDKEKNEIALAFKTNNEGKRWVLYCRPEAPAAPRDDEDDPGMAA